MRIGRVLHQHRKLLRVGLIGLLAIAGGCDGGGGEAPPPTVGPEDKARLDAMKEQMRQPKVLPKEFAGTPREIPVEGTAKAAAKAAKAK
jgi:hypothetical protein